jgi:hypothetical protein
LLTVVGTLAGVTAPVAVGAVLAPDAKADAEDYIDYLDSHGLGCGHRGGVSERGRALWMRPRHRRGVFTKWLQVIAAHGANPPRILQVVRSTLAGSAATVGTSDKPVPAGNRPRTYPSERIVDEAPLRLSDSVCTSTG